MKYEQMLTELASKKMYQLNEEAALHKRQYQILRDSVPSLHRLMRANMDLRHRVNWLEAECQKQIQPLKERIELLQTQMKKMQRVQNNAKEDIESKFIILGAHRDTAAMLANLVVNDWQAA